MDLLPHFLVPAGLLLLALYLHYYHRPKSAAASTKEYLHKRQLTRAPEPPGALPFIGHLHLMSGAVPVARILAAIADKYGGIFSLRLGSHQALVVSSWEFAKECFTTHDTIFASRPLLTLGKYMGYNQAMFALAPYGPYWRYVRKIVTLELFTAWRLEKLKHIRESEVDMCIKDLNFLDENDGGRPSTIRVNMNEWFEHLTFNIISRTLAGKRFSAGDTQSADNCFKEAIKRALYLSGIFVVSDAIPSLEWMDFGGHIRAMKQTGKEIDVALSRWLEEHKRKTVEGGGATGKATDHQDFTDVMLSLLAEDTTISGFDRDTIIKSTLQILVMTGSESTAETLIWALSLLLNNRHALQAAQAELDVQVGRDRWVQESDITNLNYLQAVVKETLRLYPPGPLSGPRQALEDCQVGGYHVQKGTRLIVNLWKIQRDARIWSNPDEFQPERFLSNHANIGFRGQQFEYIPFSSGRRMCPGVTFGLQVVHLVLARLLHGFSMTTPEEKPVDMSEGLGLSLPKVQPVDVILTPRLSLEVYQSI
ncbi:cytochrome P450 CYP82D47-like isoform X2 [Diospyros lotus]|uniref:cytochrome P450 CYP82D47-like isoform X1 n=1 Tax=Diospyros lotus TaxID=55363 RepID=UPI00225BFAD8|nr:cytochrome P450 CYP82D47-like isoform X1 [Diospyros lotus]XP_052211436.1 cytochrome P450 CYP82D47-like isoform X2 [Diospyros lotus]